MFYILNMLHYLLFSEQLPKNFRGSCSACTITSCGWSSYTEIWWDGWTDYWGRSVLSICTIFISVSCDWLSRR